MSDTAMELIWDRQSVERYWRYLGQSPESYFSFHRSKDIVHQTRRFLPRNARVVDYGCGPGYLIPALLDAGYRVTGADLSSETIGSRTPDISGRPSFEGFRTISDLLSTGERFDAAYLIEVVEHLYDAELNETLDNIKKLLRPGGALIVTTPNEEDLSRQQIYCPVSNVTFHKWQHVRSWSADTLSAALESRGYSVTEARRLNFRGNRAMSSPLYRAVGSFLARKKPSISLSVVATTARAGDSRCPECLGRAGHQMGCSRLGTEPSFASLNCRPKRNFQRLPVCFRAYLRYSGQETGLGRSVTAPEKIA